MKIIDMPLCWRCHPGQECWHRLWPEGSYPPLREKASAWRCIWCPPRCSVSADPRERTPAVGGLGCVGQQDDDRQSYICATDWEQQDVGMLQVHRIFVCSAGDYLLGLVCFTCGKMHSDLTLWLARAPLGWWKSCMVHACLPAVPLMSTVTEGLGSVSEERFLF